MRFGDGQESLAEVRLAEADDLKGEGFMMRGCCGREGDGGKMVEGD